MMRVTPSRYGQSMGAATLATVIVPPEVRAVTVYQRLYRYSAVFHIVVVSSITIIMVFGCESRVPTFAWHANDEDMSKAPGREYDGAGSCLHCLAS